MENEETNTQESSPESKNPLTKLTGEEYDAWRMTGKLPEAKDEEAQPQTEESASSESPEGAESEAVETAEPEPESESGEKAAEEEPPKQEEVKPKKESAAEKRKAQLAAEIQEKLKERAELRQEIDQLRTQISSPKTKGEFKSESTSGKPEGQTSSEMPKLEDFESYELWVVAIGKWAAGEVGSEMIAKYQAEADKKAQEAVKAEAFKQAQQSWSKKVVSASKTRADFFDVTKDAIALIPVDSEMDRIILKSEQGAVMLYHLGQNPDELERIASLEPFEQRLELARLEVSLSGNSKASPPAKRLTGAPKPPIDLGAKGTVPTDEVQAALVSGDTRAYIDRMNDRELAASKRR